MPGKPFTSKLEPFYDLIVQKRRARETWKDIAQFLNNEKKIKTTRQNVYDFFKRRRKRRYAAGMEPEPTRVSPATKPPVLPAFPVTDPNQLLKDDQISFEEAFEEMAADPNALLEDDQPSGVWGPRKLRKQHKNLDPK
jgi:hypothetical protein